MGSLRIAPGCVANAIRGCLLRLVGLVSHRTRAPGRRCPWCFWRSTGLAAHRAPAAWVSLPGVRRCVDTRVRG